MLTKIIDSTVLGEFLLSRVYAKTGDSLLSCVLAMTEESLISLCTVLAKTVLSTTKQIRTKLHGLTVTITIFDGLNVDVCSKQSL